RQQAQFEARRVLRGLRRSAECALVVSPIKTCMMHREVLVDVATGLRLPVDNRPRVVGCHTPTF
ncbi:MAG: hypothetical protein WCC93_04660, partial [Chthoniobacterales bacterium]